MEPASLKYLQGKFDFGKKCGQIRSSYITVQKLIADPLLFKKKKVDFRYYLAVFSTSPLLYKVLPGFARSAQSVFDPLKCTVK